MKKLTLENIKGNKMFWCLYMVLFGTALILMLLSDVITKEIYVESSIQRHDYNAGTICHFPYVRLMMVVIAFTHYLGAVAFFIKFIADLIDKKEY